MARIVLMVQCYLTLSLATEVLPEDDTTMLQVKAVEKHAKKRAAHMHKPFKFNYEKLNLSVDGEKASLLAYTAAQDVETVPVFMCALDDDGSTPEEVVAGDTVQSCTTAAWVANGQELTPADADQTVEFCSATPLSYGDCWLSHIPQMDDYKHRLITGPVQMVPPETLEEVQGEISFAIIDTDVSKLGLTELIEHVGKAMDEFEKVKGKDLHTIAMFSAKTISHHFAQHGSQPLPAAALGIAAAGSLATGSSWSLGGLFLMGGLFGGLAIGWSIFR